MRLEKNAVMSCSGRKYPLIVGHRGTADAPENTLAAFRNSIKQGAEMLELDVRLSRDGVPVVIHDNTLRRVTGGAGSVSSRTARHLQTLDVGSRHGPEFGGEKIPTLKETILELSPQVPLDIELKFSKPDYRALVSGVIKVIEETGAYSRLMVSSFWHDALRLFSRRLPEVVIARIFGPFNGGGPHPEDLEEIAAEPLRDGMLPEAFPFKGRVVICFHKDIDESIVSQVHSIGGVIGVYTVDAPEDMARMFRLGVDAIITNRPALLKLVLDTVVETERSG